MNKQDFKFILAYAKCYGLMAETVENAVNVIYNDSSIAAFLQYFDVQMESYIEDFLDAYNYITSFGPSVAFDTLRLMEKKDWTIWQAKQHLEDYINDREQGYLDTIYSSRY